MRVLLRPAPRAMRPTRDEHAVCWQAIAADGPPPSLESRCILSFGVPYMPKYLEWAFEIPIRTLGLAGLGMRRRGWHSRHRLH